MARPRVVQVITHLGIGGAGLHMQALCEAFHETLDIRIVCGPELAGRDSLRAELEGVVPVETVPAIGRRIAPLRDARALLELARALRRLEPDIVHSHSSKAGILSRLAAPASRCRVVHTIHGWGHTPADPEWRRRLLIGLERLAARRTDALVAVSRDVRDEGLAAGIGSPGRYRVIPAYVDYESAAGDFHAAHGRARASLGLPAAAEVAGWVGRFTPQKDPETLVRALELILVERPSLRAVLVGEGPWRPQVETSLERLGLAGRVLFTGLRSDVRSLYPAFDVLLHPSRWEGQPRVIQEAIAERVPVVATRVSGAGELVRAGRTGYLVDPGDARGLARAALAVLDGVGVSAPLAPAAVEEVAARNGREVVLERHLSLYAELLGTASRSNSRRAAGSAANRSRTNSRPAAPVRAASSGSRR